MYYVVYRITNLENDKFYIGVHQTSNLNDSYMGSGSLIRQAIAKYGRKCFRKDILWFCSSIKGMYELESIIVNEDFILQDNTYNIKVGGGGGVNGLIWVNNGKRSIYWNPKKPIPNGWTKGRLMSDEERKRWGQAFKGKSHSLEHQNKMREAAKRPKTKEHRHKLSIAKIGKSNGPHTSNTKSKISEAALIHNPGFSAKAICPYWGYEGQKANVSKHHGLTGDKCERKYSEKRSSI